MLDLLKQRRSIRKFTNEEISKENVDSILKAGLLAPAGLGGKKVELVCIEDKEVIQSLVNYKSHSVGAFKTAPLAIAVLGDSTIGDTWVEEASLSAIFMQLEAEKLGLGSVWIQIRMRETPNKENSDIALRGLLNYPETTHALCIVAIGHKDEDLKAYSDNDINMARVHYEKYSK